MLSHYRKFLIITLVAVVALVALSACGPAKVNISLTTYSIAVEKDTVSSGQVTFHVSNDATDQKHSLDIVQTDLAPDKLPRTADNNVDMSKLTVVASVPEIQPGESKDVTVNLAPGHYVIVCNLPGHYDQGMRAEITAK